LRRRAGERKVEVRQDDFRVTRYRKRSESLTIFAVDASGSSALQRLAEAKGAVEQVLADCYVRRDSVALIGFRGDGAELLLPPTKSLARAKRTLAELPGGGATPIASGIDAAIELAEDATRRGRTPVVVVMTDGRANVARDGTRGRGQAEADALVSARALRERGVRSIFVDTAPRPRPAARALAEAMDAFYLALPRVDARGIASAVRATADAGGATAGR
jgi:magnesium chelatase subunit D